MSTMISPTITAADAKHPTTGALRRIARPGAVIAVVVAAVFIGLLFAERPGAMRRTVEPRPVQFDASVLDPTVIRSYLTENGMAGRVRAVVVHLRDGSCPCSTLGDARFLALRTRHVGEDVVFATAEAPWSAGDPVRGLERLPRLPTEAAARLWTNLPAAPAVAVFDGQGTPMFLGPYAEGAHCSAVHGGRAEAALAAAGSGSGSQAMIPGEAAGCVCDTRRLHGVRPLMQRTAGSA